jgi:hypothetical protein
MAVENIDSLSQGMIEQRAVELLERADSKRQLSADSEHFIKADYRAAYNLLAGTNVTDRRGAIRKQFLEEGTLGEISARHALGRVLRRLAISPLDAELASILILLAGHFDGKIGYQTVARAGLHKWPVVELAAERRLKFDRLPEDADYLISFGWINKAWSQIRSMFR